jgi:hypothetical protein
MKLELIKYRDGGMASYTYFWKNENNQLSSPFFNSETEALDWVKEKPEPRILEDAIAEDEAFANIARKDSI